MHQQNDGRWSIENYEIWRKKPIITGPSVPLLRLRLGTWSEIRVQALELDIAEFNMHSFAKLELNENRN